MEGLRETDFDRLSVYLATKNLTGVQVRAIIQLEDIQHYEATTYIGPAESLV